MDFNEQQTEQQPDQSRAYLSQIAGIGSNMVGWLKFLGILTIIGGVIAALTIVGIIIAWLPIWLGILLFQAGNQISEANMTRNYHHLVTMMEKFKMYFVIQGVLALIYIVIVVITFLVMGASMFSVLSGDYGY